MRIRHKVPTLFNLSMVDVLCCALGCVILLWLVNQREAQDQASAAEHNSQESNQNHLSLDAAVADLQSVRASLLTSQQQERQLAAQVQQQRRQVLQFQQQIQAARREAATTRQALQQSLGQLVILASTVQTLQGQMAFANQAQHRLEKELGNKSAQLASALARATQLEQQALQSARQADLSREQLFHATAKVQLLEREANQRHLALQTTDKQLAELLSANQQLQSQLKDFKGQTQLLTGKVQELKASAEKRFAGVALTGRRVVFLLDMSGSMGKLDYQQPDPKKWPLVCATLGKVMASLPDLEQYQVIVFSDEVSYPMGRDGQWLEYRQQLSTQLTVEVLQRLKPNGATNLAAAFQEAFRFRATGMDAIYLLSDGLPNVGAGLPPGGDKLPERERTARCSKYVRDALKIWNAPQPKQPRVRINAIGFYYDSPDVGAFLWVLAREHDGSFVGMSQP